MPGNPANPRTRLQHIAHEAFIVPALRGLHQRGGAAAAQCGACDDLGLPAHSFAAGRFQLPPSADLLGLWRRGDRTLRAVGRRMDDPGAAVALSALGHLGNRQCSADKACARAMVFAMAVWTLARRQRPLKPALLQRLHANALRPRREPRLCSRIDPESSREDVNDALENPSKGSRSATDRSIGGAGNRHRHRRDRPLLQSKSGAARHRRHHRAKPDRPLVTCFCLAREPEETSRLRLDGCRWTRLSRTRRPGRRWRVGR